jgi:uncharacterized protein YndB with AHSA1/START domain
MNAVRLHRVFAAPSERVYRAILDPAANCKWLPPNGFTCTVHHLNPEVGGTHRMSFTNFSTGHSHSFGGQYLELVPHERIVATSQFEDPSMTDVMTTTYTFRPVSVGTEVHIVQENLPEQIPVEACYLGWQESLNNLARLVEVEIPEM